MLDARCVWRVVESVGMLDCVVVKLGREATADEVARWRFEKPSAADPRVMSEGVRR